MLLEILKKFKANPSLIDTRLGICWNVRSMMVCDTELIVDQFIIMYRLFETWEHYSGDQAYPIPSLTLGTPELDFDSEPKWEGRRGELRWYLIDHMIKVLENA